MKNLKLYLVLLTALVTTPMFAQIQFGAKAGVGSSNITKVHGISDSRIGFLAGGLAKIPLNYRTERHYIQAEVLYTNQGEYSVDLKDKKYKYFLNYINVPIMYKYYFDEQGSDFFVEAGPQIGFKIGDKIDLNSPERTNNDPKSLDVALNAGVGYSLDRKYEINFRYSYGLIDTIDHIRWDNDKNTTSLFSLSLSYFFN